MLAGILKKILGTKHERELKKLRPKVAAINELETGMRALSDEQLQAKTKEFKQQLDNGKPLDDLLIPAFAVCREAGRRALNMRHYDVQLIGGMTLHEGMIAEMRTGEGKTLVATLACYLNALSGKGVHVVTVNDYLASRDAEWMGRLYGFLGLTTGVVVHDTNDAAGALRKKRAYRCDITYGQNNEFGFDYLRDNMKFSINDYAQRELNFAIVDEVDSILVDEARTPLIISGEGDTATDKYMRINEIIPRLRKDEHYTVDEKNRQVFLTEGGIERAQSLLLEKRITKTENLYDPINLETLHVLNQSLRAHTLYRRDTEYMVSPDGKVMIIDEFTGRVLPGRRWSDGLHQSIEAKENVAIEKENRTLATISFQNLFRLYNKLAGMTGTAETEAEEFHKIYKLDVLPIPTNRTIQRADREDLIYKSEREKFSAIVDEIKTCHEGGRPVLVGTTSVEKSEALHRMLTKLGIPHEVLNAKQHEREAYIVAQAGKKGAVTIATNMAGRGTDILLGGNAEMLARHDVKARIARGEAPYRAEDMTPEAEEELIKTETENYRTLCEAEKQEVIAAGGLHILGTERHESRRIDNQLRGRAGRQGDPGSSRFFLSLEDDLMRIFGGERMQVLMERMGMQEGEVIEHKWVTRSVENAQKKVEERNFDTRKHMLEYDDVMNLQRKSVYALRRQLLEGHFREVLNDEQRKKGLVAKRLVKAVNPELAKAAAPILEELVKIAATNDPGPHASAEEQRAFFDTARKADVNLLGEVNAALIEREIYRRFGHRILLSGSDLIAKNALARLNDEVSWSLTEQYDRLLSLTDEIIGGLIEQNCPSAKHYEDWDFDALSAAFQSTFDLHATGLNQYSDQEDLAEKLFKDAEAVLVRKTKEVGILNLLHIFRIVYLEEIDRRWMDHLTDMEQLREGIGLLGYAERDPKKAYKKKGFDLFVEMMESVRSTVATYVFRLEAQREEDVNALEEQRRKQVEAQQARARATHQEAAPLSAETALPAEAAPQGQQPKGRATQAAAIAAQQRGEPPPPKIESVRRDRPKVGRNDPCWCGSGKKYKSCHYGSDQTGTSA